MNTQSLDLSNIEIGFRYFDGDAAERDEILRCVRNIILTPVGTVPLYRDFGIDTSFVDVPMNVAQNLCAVEIAEKVERFEPRVRVAEVTFSADLNGTLRGKAVLVRA